MRKWNVLAMVAVGLTLIMLLSYGDIKYDTDPGSVGFAYSPDLGRTSEDLVPEITLRAVVSVDADTLAALREAGRRFATERPNVTVELINVDRDELSERYRALTESGEGPELWLIPTEAVRREASEGRLVALDNYITAERQSQWFEPVRGAVRWNGYLWGVPVSWDPYVFVFRPDQARDGKMTVSAWFASGGYDELAEAASDGYGARLLKLGAASADAETEGVEPPNANEGASGSGERPAAEADSAADGAAGMVGAADMDDAADAADVPETAAEAETAEAGNGVAEEESSNSEEAAVSEADGSGAEWTAEDREAAGADPVVLAAAKVLVLQAGEEETPPEPETEEPRSPSAPLEKLKRGETAWAFARLGEAMDVLGGEGQWHVFPYVPDEGAEPGGLPPFAGSSFALSATTKYPQEAAEWIRYVTESEELYEAASRWSPFRSSFGLVSPLEGGSPLIGVLSRAGGSPLPSPSRLSKDELLVALRPLMRAIDAFPTIYGPPKAASPEETAAEQGQ